MTPLDVLSEHLGRTVVPAEWVVDQFLDTAHLRPAVADGRRCEYLIYWTQLIVFSPSSMTVERAYEALRGRPAGDEDD